ncbi:MAG: serine O-acetyltransferase EpsC [Ruminococcus sp.]|nr:serine O-acetyltransferase EpsC [Ruminococcus sp.]
MSHKLEGRINSLVDTLIDDYSHDRTIDKTVAFDHPDKEKVIGIIHRLRNIIYPGYYKNDRFKLYTVRSNIAVQLEDIIHNLSQQIKVVLRYNPKYENAPQCDIEATAEELTFAFLEKLPKIRDYIATDVEAAFLGDPAAFNKEEIIFSYPGLFAILVNRIAHELHLLGVPLIPRIMTEHAHSVTGIDIHPGASIGKYFFIDHGTGIVIGETTEIGDNVKIYQGVTLGALSTRGGQLLKNRKRHPTIEDNVTIYSGASILGGETVIGRDSVIGGNAFITKSVPAGARVSIKNPELRFNFKSETPVQQTELPQDETWFYII